MLKKISYNFCKEGLYFSYISLNARPEHQPIGKEVFGEDILLLVDTPGLVCKYAGQAFKDIRE